jgi:hypothetical protein
LYWHVVEHSSTRIVYCCDVSVLGCADVIVFHHSVCTAAVAEGSGEEHRYAGALLKEKRAFESLIATKEHMVRLPHCVSPTVCNSALRGCVVLQVISLPDHPEDVQQESKADKLLLSMDTRTLNRGSSSSSSNRAGGKRGVVVDVRDFRSTLPSALYVSGEVSYLALQTVCGDCAARTIVVHVLTWHSC